MTFTFFLEVIVVGSIFHTFVFQRKKTFIHADTVGIYNNNEKMSFDRK